MLHIISFSIHSGKKKKSMQLVISNYKKKSIRIPKRVHWQTKEKKKRKKKKKKVPSSPLFRFPSLPFSYLPLQNPIIRSYQKKISFPYKTSKIKSRSSNSLTPPSNPSFLCTNKKWSSQNSRVSFFFLFFVFFPFSLIEFQSRPMRFAKESKPCTAISKSKR